MIYFTSDAHIGHKNSHGGIINLCKRPFPSIPTMDQELVNRNNEVVTDNDEVYDLGDVAYRCSAQYAIERIRQMNGKRVVVLGNHDKPLRQAVKRGLADDLIKSGKLEIVGGMTAIEDESLLIGKVVEIDGYKVVLGHYAYRSWPSAFRKNTIHLFGHSHSNLSSFYKSMDVGVDTNNFYPYSWHQVKDIMEKKNEEFKEG